MMMEAQGRRKSHEYHSLDGHGKFPPLQRPRVLMHPRISSARPQRLQIYQVEHQALIENGESTNFSPLSFCGKSKELGYMPRI